MSFKLISSHAFFCHVNDTNTKWSSFKESIEILSFFFHNIPNWTLTSMKEIKHTRPRRRRGFNSQNHRKLHVAEREFLTFFAVVSVSHVIGKRWRALLPPSRPRTKIKTKFHKINISRQKCEKKKNLQFLYINFYIYLKKTEKISTKR